MKSKVKTGSSYGIAELYGESFVTVSNERRKQLLGLTEQPDCPHLKSYQEFAPIRKGKPSMLKLQKKFHSLFVRQNLIVTTNYLKVRTLVE